MADNDEWQPIRTCVQDVQVLSTEAQSRVFPPADGSGHAVFDPEQLVIDASDLLLRWQPPVGRSAGHR